MTDDDYLAFRAELEQAIAPLVARYANGDGEDQTWHLDRWVLVCSHACIDRPDETMTTIHSTAMPGWMIRGLLTAGRELNRRLEDQDRQERDDG